MYVAVKIIRVGVKQS